MNKSFTLGHPIKEVLNLLSQQLDRMIPGALPKTTSHAIEEEGSCKIDGSPCAS